MTDDKIDIEEIATETGIATDDVALVLRQLMGWDGTQGTWLFSNYVAPDQRDMLRDVEPLADQ